MHRHGIIASVDDWTVQGKDYVDRLHDELQRRLDESAVDRDRIREGLGSRVTDSEFGQLMQRVDSLERSVVRILTIGSVLVFLIGAGIAALRYVFG